MSKAEGQGWEDGVNSAGEAIQPWGWHSEAHARGWIRGLESLIDNANDTPDSDYDPDYETKAQRIERYESGIKETEILIDQIVGSKDHQNTIQKMAREIETLKRVIEVNY